ncbi:type I restriction enzyme, S subunit [Prevotella sp. ne3005]|uniref:restriction endonuclease subunit S n=1 Tax=Prevotella sp. ne3005 TaxID=1761887 RepID=UPI0008C8230E|nr:restriction endonuclease subunit S [Prevotella sp. ne3005]SEM95815.1 type I restriction enzyme, S subunit [Prevotella sp. ne3005]
MEYKRLGDYIEPIDERNSKLEIKLSQGICNEKYFQDPRQVAENSAADKIVRRGYFAYNRATTRNGEKISIAYREGPDCTVSSAYQVFRIKDEEKLNPKYLLMWYKRSDFDRYARFRSHGSAHEFFEYEEMCGVYLPLPDIDRQREIVEEYETLSRRIRLNEQMIEKLEATAQALYRKMFVDGIDKENLPEGWEMGTIGDLFELQRGFDLPSQERTEGVYPIYASTGITEYHNAYKVEPPCVVTGRSGTIGEVFYVDKQCWPLNTTLWVKDFKNTPPFFVYYKLKELELGKTVSGFAAVPTLNRNDVHMMESLMPPIGLLAEFEKEMTVIHHHQSITEQENEKLTELQSLLLAKMGQ